MIPLEKHWRVAARISSEAEEELRQHPALMRQVLFNRGLATQEAAESFLEAALPAHDDASEMLGVAQAGDRLLHAIEQGEQVVVYGDYDADGVCAAALMVETLSALGAQVRGYIPNRFDEGYGLNVEALDSLKEDGADLVLTVDCGIRALKEAEHARALGLDLIVSDHHTPGKELPAALAVVNPKLPGDPYPEKNLSGVGVAYKLALALIERLRPINLVSDDLLDLVALGTVADLVPLVGENRALVRAGLERIRRPERQGLLSLIGVAGLQASQVTSGHIGFMLGPRLNAAGRLDTALDAYHLLLTEDVFEAGRLAQLLDNRNRERQRITDEVVERSEALALDADPAAPLLFAADPEFNAGVVGLAASRLVERYYRPAVVAQRGQEFTRASCRSIPEFHITEALEACADLFDHFGGHAAAAGFTVRNDNLPELVERLEAIAADRLAGLDLRPTLQADAEVPLSELKPELLPHLEKLEPTGYGNPAARFVSRGLQVKHSRAVGRDGTHLKLSVSDGWVTFDAIAFRQGHWQESMPAEVDLLYAFELNEYNGRKSLQLNVKDIKAADQGRP